jgi:plastocyanin
MRFKNRLFRFVAALAAAAPLLASAAATDEGNVVVNIVDRDGNPVPEAVVYAEALFAAEAPSEAAIPSPAVIDQKNRSFVPHILVVRTGTQINFPNSDSVSHHVYSFSPAKSFELALYKQGTMHPPLLFDTAGVVTLGCNIHDDMIGYILVVDTPYFTATDAEGNAMFAGLPAGQYRVNVWTPRLRPADLPPPMEITVAAGQTTRLASRFTAKLFPPHATVGSSLQWSHY